ncbi:MULTISPECIES: hypothetical protein [Kamptonema]|uniref:hypothetical protein n=1 Tax=Kamptonema TaxID=1501433 RepID=UPI0001DAD002|nr:MULTISPECIES: hypothetical protein [Kamptonema]CBN54614.1 hypothetical protein OSCI_1000007 [Kamptonema sp. PCC 6506]
MTKPCNQPLKANPFTADRDPDTGKWTVKKIAEQNYKSDSHLNLVQPSGSIDNIHVKSHLKIGVAPE